MSYFLDSKHKDHANKDGTMTDAQKHEYLEKFRADLISPAEAALWDRGASNAGYHYLGCAKTFARMGRAFAEALLSPPAIRYETRDVSGWQVHIQEKLLTTARGDTEKALGLLAQMLDEIVRLVPADAVARLRQVPLYFSPAYPKGGSGAEYHPGADWLRENGRDPAMVRGVEFSGIADFEAEMKRMPNFALHELAHAYHDRVLDGGFGNTELQAAYERAKSGGGYERVERVRGHDRPNSFERAYALTNAMEYFAESTEAYFVRNDFFPFTRAELRKHDPAMLALVEKLWGVPAEK